jgi:HSP20 family protein
VRAPKESPIHNPRAGGPSEGLLRDFPERLEGDRFRPAADIFETAEAIVVRLELPGVLSDQVRVNVEGERLRISGVREPPGGSPPRRLHRMEIGFGPFERVISIPISFDKDEVRAHLENGFLDVTIPKRSSSRRQVEVQSR